MALPEKVAEQDNPLRVLAVGRIGREQSASQHGRDAEITARVGAELDRRHILREIFARDSEIPRPPRGRDAFDALHLLQELELGAGEADKSVVSALVHNQQADHAIGALIGERIGEKSIDDTEDGCGGADSQGE